MQPYELLQSLQQLTEQLDELAPEIVEVLGTLATQQYSEQNQRVAAEIADAAESLQVIGDVILANAAVLVEPIPEAPDEPVAPQPHTQEADTPVLAITNEATEAIWRYADVQGAFRIEQARRDIPLLREMSSEQYVQFKAQLPHILELIQQRIHAQGHGAAWQRTGRARGTRYNLITDCPPPPEDNPGGSTPAEPQSHTRSSKVHTPPPTDEHVQTMFSQKLLEGIASLEANRGGRVRVSELVRHITDALPIDDEDAKGLVRTMIEQGLIFAAGNLKGSPCISTREHYGGNKSEAERAQNAKEQEEARIRELRNTYGSRIILALNKLRGQESAFRTTIAQSLPDKIASEDINRICSLLQQEGLVQPKMPKGRGSGSSRKGKTWLLTPAGRAAATGIQGKNKAPRT